MNDLDNYRRDANALRLENGGLRSDAANAAANLAAAADENNRLLSILAANGIDPGRPNNGAQMNGMNAYSQEQYSRLQRPADGYAPRTTEQLPPIRNIGAPLQGSDSIMSDVPYPNEHRLNGYRPGQQRF